MADNKRILYVGGLADEVTEDVLEDAFRPFGDVILPVKLPRHGTGPNDRHRGFAFVEMETSEDAAAAMENMMGAELFGKTLKVNIARPEMVNSDVRNKRVKMPANVAPMNTQVIAAATPQLYSVCALPNGLSSPPLGHLGSPPMSPLQMAMSTGSNSFSQFVLPPHGSVVPGCMSPTALMHQGTHTPNALSTPRSTPHTVGPVSSMWDVSSPSSQAMHPSFGSPPLHPSPSPSQSTNQMVLSVNDDTMTMIVKLDKYVPQATNPNETLEEKNFRHALPPRLLHKHKAYVESLIGPHAELIINVPPGLVELSRKRLSRGDSRYKGLADMNIEAKIVGKIDPVFCNQVLDKLFFENKRTVKSSRRRCFEVINSVKNLTEATGAFVISRPADECVDVYGPEHVVDSAIEYLMSMQSQSGVSKRVIAVSPAAASAVIKARRTILPREQGSLFVEPLPKGSSQETQTVTIYAYVDPSHLDVAEDAIRRIELGLTAEAADEDSLCGAGTNAHTDPCADGSLQIACESNSQSHSPPPLLEEHTDDDPRRRGSLASPKALLAALKLSGHHVSPTCSPKGGRATAEVLRAIQQDMLASAASGDAAPPPAPAVGGADTDSEKVTVATTASSQGLSPQVSAESSSSPGTPVLLHMWNAAERGGGAQPAADGSGEHAASPPTSAKKVTFVRAEKYAPLPPQQGAAAGTPPRYPTATDPLSKMSATQNTIQ